MSQQAQVRNTLSRMRNEAQQIVQKAAELDAQRDEHLVVIRTLEGMDPSRKCFRSIGGVLVERTVAEVLPAVKQNADNLGSVIGNLKKEVDERNKQMQEYAMENGLLQMEGDK